MPVRRALPGVDTLHLSPFAGPSSRFCLFLCLSLCLLFSACNFESNSDNGVLGSRNSAATTSSSSSGGSGSGRGSGAEMTGVLVAGGVKGLRYKTPSFSGLTDSKGSFRYRDGEEVKFTLGGITFGSAAGATKLNLFNLVGSTPLTEESELRAALENHQRVSDLDLVSNMMLLLMTLDRDQDPQNGIDLTGWDRELVDQRMDFYFDLYAYANRRGLDSLPAIKSAFHIKYQLPLDAPLVFLYQALGIVVATRLPVLETRDIDDNDTIEQEVRWQYNPFGLPREMRLTILPDTATSWRERLLFDYDSQARLVFMLRETDTNENGDLDFFYRSERFYSNSGFLVEVIEEDGQLRVGERRSYRFDYDDGGNNSLFTYKLDDDLDSFPDSIFRIENYFSDDGLLELREEQADLNGDGRPQRRQRFEFGYNTGGLLVVQEDALDKGETVPADGLVDRRIEVAYRYSNGERLLREVQRIDENDDGVVEQENTVEYFYLSNGLLREQVWEFDLDANGTVETRRTFKYRYSSGDNLLRMEMILDKDANGFAESRVLAEYRYNSRGQLRETEITTFGGDDVPQSLLITRRVYGSHGELLDWYREGEGYTGTTNTPIRLRWRYLEFDDGLRYLIDHFRYRQPAYAEVGTTNLYMPCLNYRFSESGTICAVDWPAQWKLLWGGVWKAPGVNLGGPVVVRP